MAVRPAILVILAVLLSTASAAKYLGCYKDRFSPNDRDFGDGWLFIEDDLMSPAICEARCARGQYKYFGLQYGMECWCGNSYGRYERMADSDCLVKCAGNPTEFCGGDLLNSVYQVETKVEIAPRDPNERPTLGLVMIVKDEAHTLPATLMTLKPVIDWYYILDTGSTDGTQDAIRKTLGPNGYIFQEPFIDYGRSRNRALELAQQSDKPPVFSLMLSADETMHYAEDLRKFCEEHKNSQGEAHEAYPIQMDVGWRFDSLRLSRTDSAWRYVGRVHEYLAAPDRKWHPTIRVPKAYIKFKVTDHERRANREWTILRILLEEKEENPTNTRTSFYLARTYNVLKNHTEALKEFHRRVELGGWAEEVYESLYAIGWQLKHLQRDWTQIQQAWMNAHQYAPERAEPLYAIANYWWQESKWPLTYLFASRAAQIPYPSKAVLWVQRDVYGWQSHMLTGISAYEIGLYEVAAKALLSALGKQPKDQSMLSYLEKTKNKLSLQEWTAILDNPSPATIGLQAPVPPEANPILIAQRAELQTRLAAKGSDEPRPAPKSPLDEPRPTPKAPMDDPLSEASPALSSSKFALVAGVGFVAALLMAVRTVRRRKGSMDDDKIV